MGKDSEELRRMIHSLANRGPAVQVRPSLAPSSEPELLVPGLLALLGVFAGMGLWGAAVSLRLLSGLASVGSLVVCVLMTALWKRKTFDRKQSITDVAVEVIKRKASEMEKDRLRKELQSAYASIQQVNESLLKAQEAFRIYQAQMPGMLAEEEKKIRQVFDSERENFREMLSDREKRINELSEQVIKLQDSLDQQIISTPGEMSKHADSLKKTFEEERSGFLKKFHEQEVLFQRKLSEFEAGRSQEKADLEKKLEEISHKALTLQEALDRKLMGTSDEMASHVEQMRRSYQQEKANLEKRLKEQEESYEKKFSDQESQFQSMKMEFLSACETLLTELEAREEKLSLESSGERNGKS